MSKQDDLHAMQPEARPTRASGGPSEQVAQDGAPSPAPSERWGVDAGPAAGKPAGQAHMLGIIELGGYPNFAPLYKRLGFAAELVSSQRKAQAALKRRIPAVIVAEYNFQSDFRDRTSNLETLMARLQKHPEVRVICIYQPEHAHKLEVLRARFPVFAALPLPVTEADMEAALRRALSG